MIHPHGDISFSRFNFLSLVLSVPFILLEIQRDFDKTKRATYCILLQHLKKEKFPEPRRMKLELLCDHQSHKDELKDTKCYFMHLKL